MEIHPPRLVIIESPFAGDYGFNLGYARRAMKDCLARGEAPFASHLLYTQRGILNDRVPDERKKGMEAGFAWGEQADATVVYVDLGISDGMRMGIERAKDDNRPVEYRKLFSGEIPKPGPTEPAMHDDTALTRGARPQAVDLDQRARQEAL